MIIPCACEQSHWTSFRLRSNLSSIKKTQIFLSFNYRLTVRKSNNSSVQCSAHCKSYKNIRNQTISEQFLEKVNYGYRSVKIISKYLITYPLLGFLKTEPYSAECSITFETRFSSLRAILVIFDFTIDIWTDASSKIICVLIGRSLSY